MKLAKLSDFRRALESRNLGTVPCLRRLAFQQLPGFADTDIEPNASFLAICGGTGVGKTALLELIYSALAPLPEPHPIRPSPRLGIAKADVRVTFPDGAYERHLDLENLEEEWVGFAPEVQIIGLGERTSDLQSLFCAQDVSVIKEGAASFELSDEIRSFVSMICRKEFSRIVVYETDTGNDSAAPFFEVEISGVTYDSRGMATGELSVLYIAWSINRVPQLSIILIEEPEAYLPPSGHGAMFGLICVAAVRRQLGLVITTHSPDIASEVPQASLLSIRTQAGVSLLPVSAESKQRVLSRLGLAPQKSAVIFVEDDVAQLVLEEILSYFEFSISTSIEIVPRNGAGGVRSTLDSLPVGIRSFSFLGVLDGDMIVVAQNWGLQDLILFLPFALAMEQEFLAAIAARTAGFGKVVNRTEIQINDLLNASLGQDAHDRFQQLAVGLGLPRDAFARTCFAHWLKGPGKRAATRRFAHSLAEKLGVALP